VKTNTDRYQVLQSDATTRLPVIFLIDQSFSMRMTFGGTPTGETVEKDGKTWHYAEGGKMLITTLLEGIKKYAEEIRGDTRASVCVELCVLSFGDNTHIIQDFQPISTETIDIDPNDANTNLGRAVKVAIQLLQRRKSEYTGYGIDCYQPQLVIFTDGMATDIGECKSIAAEVQTLMKAGKLVCVPFLIGTEEGAQVLSMFGPENEVFALDTQALLEVLKFLSGSAIAVSKSQAGDSGEETKKMLEALRKKAKDWKTI
jgi:uncharacterized protein YegL